MRRIRKKQKCGELGGTFPNSEILKVSGVDSWGAASVSLWELDRNADLGPIPHLLHEKCPRVGLSNLQLNRPKPNSTLHST